MSIPKTPFEIEYRHGIASNKKETPMSTTQKSQILVLVFISMVSVSIAMFLVGVQAGILIFPALFIAYLIYCFLNYEYTPPPSILLEPRFLVCAKTVIYYALLEKIKITDSTVELVTNGSTVLIIDCSRFTSVSTKPEKSKLNKQKKFNRVVEELLSRAKSQNMDLKIER